MYSTIPHPNSLFFLYHTGTPGAADDVTVGYVLGVQQINIDLGGTTVSVAQLTYQDDSGVYFTNGHLIVTGNSSWQGIGLTSATLTTQGYTTYVQ